MREKILRWIWNIVVFLLIASILSLFYTGIKHKNDKNYIPSVFGIKFMTVLSGSMQPNVEVGDLVVIRPIVPKKIKKGDIITYRLTDNIFITHRVIGIIHDNNECLFITKGDANNVKDDEKINSGQLVGKVFLVIPNGGYILYFLKKSIVFTFLILILLIIFIRGEIKIFYLKKGGV
ncbi:signal peptidase I [Caloranaerobacter sp. DY30410]|uniref:signal peptidase I n=1 Tax=Caloranaerobacter sp. DY30410 TaxID=3238305 RepID=UPI003D0660F7